MSKVLCGNCGKRIDKEWAVKRSIQHFCPEHPYPPAKPPKQYRRKPPKTAAIPPGIRKQIAMLDGVRCRYCGSRYNLHVHHVIYRSDKSNKPWQDEISNLITLCQTHHDLVHSDKHRFLPLLLGVIWLRNVRGDQQISVPALERKLRA